MKNDKKLLKDFTERHHLTPARRRPCFLELLGKHCSPGATEGNKIHGVNGCLPPGSDHVSLWNKDGNPRALISQPYSLESCVLNEMVSFAKQHELEFTVSPYPSWHNPGEVLTVIWTREGVWLSELPLK